VRSKLFRRIHARVEGDAVKLTQLSDAAVYALSEALPRDAPRGHDLHVELTRTTATIPVDELGDVIAGLENYADLVRAMGVDARVDITPEFEETVLERKLLPARRLIEALRPLEQANEAPLLFPEYYESIEGPQFLNLRGKRQHVQAVGFGDLEDITVVHHDGSIRQYLYGEWSRT